MAQTEFFTSIGIHRAAIISEEPELVRIKYIDTKPSSSGSKGTILLIHGWPQTSYQFRKVIRSLADEGYRVITPDYRGSGDSSKPMNLEGYRKVTMAADLRSLLRDHIGIKDKVHVVGHDIGGMIAHAYAASFPNDTASIIWGECRLPGSTSYHDTKDSLQLFHFNFHKVLDLPEILIKGNERAYLKHFYDKICYNAAAITPGDMDYYAQQYAQPGGIRASINVYRLFERDAEDNVAMREKSGKCKVPCLTLCGDKSFIASATPDEAAEFYEQFESAEIEEAMHYVAEENPKGFVRELLKFIGAH
ncbi:hypothetical protein PMZ80_002367 [Knufia obscura]|uniref:AB hydrolase-1 domain-containing protein n=2 Tax=Knufia TaxID=430999 RepID=A0AAN8I3Q2_9EURO|nr:hypothetical protein PMZ80_002367 [Knufia obscura]KAK5948621.1 hypothetical protein OHC33_010380 [Knufia fluminis]